MLNRLYTLERTTDLTEVGAMAASKRGIDLNEWNISWDEYKELDYFCRQYDRKRAEAAAMLTLRISTPDPVRLNDGSGVFMPRGSGGVSDPVSAAAEKRDRLLRDVRMIEHAARIAAGEYAPYILKAVTKRCGVQRIIADGCPCSERVFYRMRRKFYYTLKELKDSAK